MTKQAKLTIGVRVKVDGDDREKVPDWGLGQGVLATREIIVPNVDEKGVEGVMFQKFLWDTCRGLVDEIVESFIVDDKIEIVDGGERWPLCVWCNNRHDPHGECMCPECASSELRYIGHSGEVEQGTTGVLMDVDYDAWRCKACGFHWHENTKFTDSGASA